MSKATPPTAARPVGGPAQKPQDYLNPGTMQEIALNRLNSGLNYQRTVKERTVQKLVNNWNPIYLDPIVVSYRDGRYNVIDGQHRVTAMKRMSESGKTAADVKVLCVVHTGLTFADEAELFYKLDQCRKKLSSAQSINALLQSGADAEINEIFKMLKDRHFKWTLDNSAAGDYKIKATRAVIYAYRLLGRKSFPRLLVLLSDTWQGDPASLTAMMLSGTALFLKTYETEINDRTFITRFQTIRPETIVSKARTDFSITRNDLRCARSLLYHYNKFIRGEKNKLDPSILW